MQDAQPTTRTLHYLHTLTISQGPQVTAEPPAFQSDTWPPHTNLKQAGGARNPHLCSQR